MDITFVFAKSTGFCKSLPATHGLLKSLRMVFWPRIVVNTGNIISLTPYRILNGTVTVLYVLTNGLGLSLSPYQSYFAFFKSLTMVLISVNSYHCYWHYHLPLLLIDGFGLSPWAKINVVGFWTHPGVDFSASFVRSNLTLHH